MIEIITPSQFKTLPWKNGKGETIEMAINEGGDVNQFDWRLSMASVVEDGVFSNFSGYTRNLVLIEGEAITLQHNHNRLDKLTKLLDFATFDGGNTTVGNVPYGPIIDFNIITRTSKYLTKVATYQQVENVALQQAPLCFIYSLSDEASIVTENGQTLCQLPAQHLLKTDELAEQKATISGNNLIVVYLQPVI